MRAHRAADATLPRGDIEAVGWHVFRPGGASLALRCLTAVGDPRGSRGNISSTMYKRKWLVAAVIGRRRRRILSKDVTQAAALPCREQLTAAWRGMIREAYARVSRARTH
ncbi:hypothetical protein HPB50_024016 [Hyalomma asiaticum]|uniref:Uncharacterized protein n=1 Tax=Hyalomma asiaticum TaxID=266040 RepID=A0ACB7T524_HYAAI|nr:hypothetical protein HPB50_024016 [Hyalomma asiaticum]